MKYNKPPLSIAQQIQILRQRGLTFKDEERAKRYLSFISLYRLRAYTYTYQNNTDPHHPFNKGVNFDIILNTYLFDRKLRYSRPKRPPAWMSLEIISLGLLSKIYENLRISPEKKTIANNFNLGHPKVLESWMHSIAVIRNICAHHGRLWNRALPARMKLPKNTSAIWLINTDFPHGKLYLALSSLLYLLNKIIPGNHFIIKFRKLSNEYPDIPLKQMGFPDNWEKEKLWSNK